jgi:phosphatidylinositol kinase/protein kinase (PI-3  family)
LDKFTNNFLYIPFRPAHPIQGFSANELKIFPSKKKPLLICGQLASSKDKTCKFIFKFGDDLRQDNLVLQLFKLMDHIWQENGLDMHMVTYDVMETGFNTGYIEYVDDAVCISHIHKHAGFWSGTYRENSIFDYFMKEIAT